MKKEATVKRATFGLLIVFLIFSMLLLNSLVNAPVSAKYKPASKSVESKGNTEFVVPIVPHLRNQQSPAVQAIDRFFGYTKTGGWVDINSLNFDDIHILRSLSQTIMDRNITCGQPKVFHEALASGLEYCFWDNDLVSKRTLYNFGWEHRLWGWVNQEFQGLQKLEEQLNVTTTCHLGFLDMGTNVGDWATPLRVALPPTTPLYAIEGNPATAAIAIANMRTAVEHLIRSGRHHAATTTTTALLPFSLISSTMVETVRERDGICFDQPDGTNVGGQLISRTSAATTKSNSSHQICKPSMIAGGTLLSHALQSLMHRQPSSCPGKQNWPRIYIAKLDIQGFEFKALVSALDWLTARPPCYLIVEIEKNKPQTTAMIELLLDLGYDSMWRTVYEGAFVHYEFPPRQPYWSQSRNSSTIDAHSAVTADLNNIPGWKYKDYMFGFEDKKRCLYKLLE